MQEFRKAIEANGLDVLFTEDGRMFITHSLFFAVIENPGDDTLYQFGLFEDGEESLCWHGNVFSSTMQGAIDKALNTTWC